MKIGYYPGCCLSGTAREYDESLRELFLKLGFELTEVSDWNCCGASAAHNLNHELSLALPARILALAERQGLSEILVPCAACYHRLLSTQHALNEDAELRKKVCATIELEYAGTSKITNALEALAGAMADLKEGVPHPFQRKVACYYGCLLVRPPKIKKADRPEDPQTMEQIMKLIGAEPVDWAFKVECCGAGLSVSRTDIVAKLSARIVEDAAKRGSEAIIVACPMCQSNFDVRRDKIEKLTGKKYSIPVLYITQAVGLAMGISEEKLGLRRHLVPVKFSDCPARAAAGPAHSKSVKS